MADQSNRVRSWGEIVLILLGVAVALGLLLGGLGPAVGIPASATAGGIGAGVGVVGAVLIGQRRAALARREER